MRYTSASNQTSFRSNEPLTNEQIAIHAPSVMAEAAHESRSDRYAVIPTIQVLDGLRKEGFEPYEVRQTVTRDASKRSFAKHLIRMRHRSHFEVGDTAEEFPEIIMLNSHDGTSSYQLMSGFFRMVCSNGLISGDIADDIRIRHTGDVVSNVIEGSYRVLDNIELAQEHLNEYKGIHLSEPEMLAFSNAAIDLKWERDELTQEAPVTPERLLAPRRSADMNNDLWSTMNVLQENIMKGGLRSAKRGKNGRVRRSRTRGVNSVTENVRLNKAIWSVANVIADIKQNRLTLEDLQEVAA